MKLTCFLIILSLLSCFPLCLYADQKDTAAVTMNIPSICKLTVDDSDVIIDLLQDASGESAYEDGYIEGDLNAPKLLVDSNTNWKLTVAVSMDWSQVEGYQKATEDIRLKVTSSTGHQTGFNDFTALTLEDQEIAAHTSGVGNDTYNCQYKILLNWEKDIPGIYVIIITYTLSTKSL